MKVKTVNLDLETHKLLRECAFYTNMKMKEILRIVVKKFAEENITGKVLN